MSGFLQKLQWRVEVLAYDIVRLLMLPFSLDKISGFGGWLAEKIGPKTSKHQIAKINMKIAFPEADDKQIEKWLLESWNQMGRTMAEFPLLHRIKVFDQNSRVQVDGLERLEKLKQEGKAAVLVSGHFANWEIMAAVFSQAGLPVRVTYRPTNNPYFDKRIRATRARYGIDLMVAKSGAKGAKQLIKALKSGESVALLNDQKFNEGIEVDFFGKPAMTAPGPTRLALQTGVDFIPMSIVRTQGAHFKVTVHEPIALNKSANRKADIKDGTEKITRFVEDFIRTHPSQWFWVHRRWPKEIYKKN